jgi:hypothetical protein
MLAVTDSNLNVFYTQKKVKKSSQTNLQQTAVLKG